METDWPFRLSKSPRLCKSVVSDSFHGVGVVPVIHMSMNKYRNECLKDSGIIRMSSFGMSSGPGALLFRRALIVSWKVCSLSMYESRWGGIWCGFENVNGSRVG